MEHLLAIRRGMILGAAALGAGDIVGFWHCCAELRRLVTQSDPDLN